MAEALSRIVPNSDSRLILLIRHTQVTLAEIAKRLGGKALKDIARVAKSDPILDWHRRLVAQKFNGPGFGHITAGVFYAARDFGFTSRSIFFSFNCRATRRS